MVSIDEDISPASIPTTSTFIWSKIRSSEATESNKNEKVIRFNHYSSFRFERTDQEFDTNTQATINLRIKYTNPNYKWCCLGVAWETNFNGNKGVYIFDKSIMYTSFFPKVTIYSEDLSYKKFTVNNNDLVSISFDPDNMIISYKHNEVDLGEINLPGKKFDEDWFFTVGMFEGEIEIID